MKIEIKHRFTASVLFEHDAEDNSMKLTFQLAIKNKVDLSGADLRSADLRSADLRGAYLSGAYLSGADLQPIRADFYDVLSHAGREVPALIEAIRKGRVDGSTYTGECACLVGTIANVRGVDYNTIEHNASRPIERFFGGIKEGDTPETNPASKLALEWAEAWLTMQREAFAPSTTA